MFDGATNGEQFLAIPPSGHVAGVAASWQGRGGGRTNMRVRGITLPQGFTLEDLEKRDRLLQGFDKGFKELDEKDEFPEELVRRMCGEELGVQLLFVAEEHGGMGGSALDVYRVCERMAAIDLGIATSVLATFLGSDPILVGGTPEQQALWLGRVAEEGILMAYGATEPDAGSDLAALKTTAKPVVEGGDVVGYRLNGAKQWISNGGIADAATVLALAPGGPTWFVVDGDAPGLVQQGHITIGHALCGWVEARLAGG